MWSIEIDREILALRAEFFCLGLLLLLLLLLFDEQKSHLLNFVCVKQIPADGSETHGECKAANGKTGSSNSNSNSNSTSTNSSSDGEGAGHGTQNIPSTDRSRGKDRKQAPPPSKWTKLGVDGIAMATLEEKLEEVAVSSAFRSSAWSIHSVYIWLKNLRRGIS